MSRKGRNMQSAIERLVEQRRLIQDWLARVGDNVDGMPAHVVERVTADYKNRLAGVTAELAGHREALSEALDEAEQRQEELEQGAKAREDELAELRLRRQVGEIEEDQFKTQSTATQAALDQIRRDLAATERDIERYEEILDVIAQADRRAAAPAEPAEPAQAASAAAGDGEAAPAKPPERPESAPPGTKKEVDELAFLRSVTTAVPPARGSQVMHPPAAEPKAAAPPPAPPAPPSPPPTPPAPPSSQAPPPAAPPTVPPAPAPVRKDAGHEAGAAVSIDAAPGLIEMPAAAKAAAPAPAPKPAARADAVQGSLVCKECGAANRPTEWYCEKCGAELAAV